jgi:hypothetical protein
MTRDITDITIIDRQVTTTPIAEQFPADYADHGQYFPMEETQTS